jgi:hypothetical protein
MLGGTRDGMSPGWNDARYTLRRTVDDAFAKQRRESVDVDVVIFRGSNCMVPKHQRGRESAAR